MELQTALDWAEQEKRRKADELKQTKRKRDVDFKKRRSIELLAGYDQKAQMWR